ncbi:hypothetical protein PPYR_02338, partial [Photinus pyralis]
FCHSKLTPNTTHLRRHEISNVHIKNIKAAASTPSILQHTNVTENQRKKQRQIRRVELKMCAYICEHNFVFLLMDSLPIFCKNVFTDSDIAKNISMKRKKATQIIVGVLSPYIKGEISRDLQERYWKGGTVKNRFLDLIEVESSTAESLFHSVQELLISKNIHMTNLIGFSADNANVMIGNIK